ncbi:MAG: 4Fe-4S binding protein [Crocinitomicaceae bacterium]
MRKLGWILVFVAIGIFISTLFLNSYTFLGQEYPGKSQIFKIIDLGIQRDLETISTGEVRNMKFSMAKNLSEGPVKENPWIFFLLTFGLAALGSILIFIQSFKKSASEQNLGVFHQKLTNRKWPAYLLLLALIAFYVLLYWFPYYLVEWTILVDPIAQLFNSEGQASHWFLYGFMYSYIMTLLGIRMVIKYRHNNYQIIRTITVWFFQIVFAFTIPEILASLNGSWAGIDLKNMWPLDYDFFNNGGLVTYATESQSVMVNGGGLGLGFLIWGIVLFAVLVPILVYFFGKRWYCSWVCGCGGLAETLGDAFRHLSDNSLKAWKIERWMVHSVLVLAILMTILTFFTMFTGVWGATGFIQEWYGFLIGSVFAGVIGTGFYPVFGNRVWCRFGCPLAAYMGIIQRFKSRFRVTVNGDQCISCGNCSTHCEMGIDVKAYAQKGQDIQRASCVGCGICEEVCPRGVLKLENKK